MDRSLAPIDVAHTALHKILAEFGVQAPTDQTESDTRLKLIDRVLTEVLGWSHSQIATERSDHDGRVDYILTAGTEKVIVEAKRATTTFDLQTTGSARTSFKVSSPILRGGNAGAAMSQAEEYARNRGVALTVATTGLQWILFLASRTDGVRPSDGHAFVFYSGDDLLRSERFRLFHELLSRESVRSQFYRSHFLRLEGRLQDAKSLQAQRYIEQVPGPDRQRKLSDIAKALDPVIDELLTNIPEQKKSQVLRDCFVSTRESEEADGRLKRLLQELTEDIETLDTRNPDGDRLSGIVRETINAPAACTVLLIGQVGAGKSTYLSRFFEDILPGSLRKRIVFTKIDLLHGRADEQGFSSYLREQTLATLKRDILQTDAPSFEKLEGAFFSFYNQLREGELKFLYQNDPNQFKARFGEWLLELQENKPEVYVRELLSHAQKSRKKLVCVVFDNVDHYSDKVQELAFSHAQWLSGLGRVLTVLPIRDTTYWRSKTEGAFHASSHTALYLPRPPLDKVLGRRFDYAQKQLQNLKAGTDKDIVVSSLRGFRIKVDKPSELFRLLTDIFSVEVYPNDILRGLSGGDVREALKIFRQVVTSPWMSIDTLLAAYLVRGKYRLKPADEAKIDRAAILGLWEHFSQERSLRILNLLWSPRTTECSPLLSLRVLERIYELRENDDPRAGRGFEAVDHIVDYFSLCGVPAAGVDKALVELVNARLLEPFDISILSGNTPLTSSDDFKFVTITSSGRLHRRWIQSRPSYGTSMVEDAAIFDEAVFSELCRLEGYRSEALRKAQFSQADVFEAQIAQLVKSHLLLQDAGHVTLPSTPEFDGQRRAGESIFNWVDSQGFAAPRRRPSKPLIEDGAKGNRGRRPT
jgi:hypothetical protein